MTDTKHTPLPWAFDMGRHTHDSCIYCVGADRSEGCRRYGYIGGEDGGVIGSSEWIWIKEADAALIVARVNAGPLADELAETVQTFLNAYGKTGRKLAVQRMEAALCAYQKAMGRKP